MTDTRRSVTRGRIRYNQTRRRIWRLSRTDSHGGNMLRLIFPHYDAQDLTLVSIVTERYGHPRRPVLGIAPRGALLFKDYPAYIKGPTDEQKGS